MIHVVHVAGGLNSRLEELSMFPKCLVPTKYMSAILMDNYNILLEYCDKQYVVVNKFNAKIIETFIKLNKLNIEIIVSDSIGGTFNTLCSIDINLPDKAFYMWGDIILDHEIAEKIFKDCIYEDTIFAYGKRSRYFVGIDNCITKPGKGGNVIGIFYIKNKNEFFKNFNNFEYKRKEFIFNDTDVVDRFINLSSDKRNVHIELSYSPNVESIETKSDVTFLKGERISVDNFAFYGRPTTRILFTNDHCIKTSTESKKLVNEQMWYNYVSQLKPDIIPYVVSCSEDSIVMENLVGYTSLFSLRYNSDFEKYFNIAFESVVNLHNTLPASSIEQPKNINYVEQTPYFSDEEIEEDIIQEFYERPLERVSTCMDLIPEMNLCTLNILEKELRCATQSIIKYVIEAPARRNYVLIHGDLNGSNIMINLETLKVKFIDPRGKFGKTRYFGLREYDYSKLVYFLKGYDEFNNNYKIFYNKEKYDSPRDLMALISSHLADVKILQIMSAIHFISLSPLVCNNIYKVNIAFWHGLQTLQKLNNSKGE
jgi:choline kinase